MNCRIKPFWPKYQATFKRRGFQLDTLKDVKLFYNQRSQDTPSNCFVSQKNLHTTQDDDDSLCPDAGLVCASPHGLILTSSFATPQPDNLFRGTQISDAKRVVVKAVHAGSREYDVIWTLSQPPLRDDPMNHTIRKSLLYLQYAVGPILCFSAVLDLFGMHNDRIAFIVMEEWSSGLIPSTGPCCLKSFLEALRQCIEVRLIQLSLCVITNASLLACCVHA